MPNSPKRIGILFATREELPETIPYTGLGSVETCRMGSSDIAVVISGIGQENAGRAIDELCREFGPDYVLSSGICGGTKPYISIGDLLVADSVRYKKHEIPLACPELERMIAFLPQNGHCHVGKFQTFDHLVTAETYVHPDVIGVDVESYGVVAAAHQHRTPLVIVRAVSDLVFTGEFTDEGFAIARESLDAFFRVYTRHM